MTITGSIWGWVPQQAFGADLATRVREVQLAASSDMSGVHAP